MGQRCQKNPPTPSLSFNPRPQTRLPITVLTLDQSAGTFPEIAEATMNLESLQPIGGHGNLHAQRAGACAIVSALKGLSLTPLPSSFCRSKLSESTSCVSTMCQTCKAKNFLLSHKASLAEKACAPRIKSNTRRIWAHCSCTYMYRRIQECAVDFYLYWLILYGTVTFGKWACHGWSNSTKSCLKTHECRGKMIWKHVE